MGGQVTGEATIVQQHHHAQRDLGSMPHIA